ncbi:Regulatory protein RecX [Arabidopsis thaliana x Arabidopsis arenosa]|uniref:Regulatory protein RecX n=1 Tax=Arabidopsis thaliana x Arabidopsis arenosa TaxID=1240361 RepID=A0A8T2ATV3_9BRAS|nr:Regulatory protein RecX [Arabidopsis thaliana x Arabidopsis arenosa]
MLKLGFRLSIAIQHRVFVIPWVKRHSAPRILCSEQRDYSSSGLIKYVPNKSRKITQDLTSQPLDVTRLDHSVLGSQVKGNCKEARDGTFLDLQEKNDTGSYMNVSCDDSDEGIMSLDKGINVSRWDHSVLGSKVKEETGEGTDLHLRDKNDAEIYSDASCDDSNEELEESSNEVRSTGYKSTRQHKQAYDKVKLHMEAEQAKSSKEACKTTQEAEHMAMRYLGLRAYSAADLKKKLIGKKYPLEVVDRVINDFQIRGFINDSLYAESFTRSRWSSLSWGPRRIKQALFKKGISNKDSETAIKLVFEKHQCKEGDEEAELNHGLSKEAVDQLYVQASKRWLQGRDLPIETRKARVIRWLQYRGFNWGVVAQLLKRLESTHES